MLAGVEASAGRGPVPGAEFEVATIRPMREDAEQVAQVDLEIELVQPCGGDQGQQVAGSLGVVVAAVSDARVSALPAAEPLSFHSFTCQAFEHEPPPVRYVASR